MEKSWRDERGVKNAPRFYVLLRSNDWAATVFDIRSSSTQKKKKKR